MAGKILKEEVSQVAGLARLKFRSGELEGFTRELHHILDYIGKLQELKTKGAKVKLVATPHHPLKNVFREDKIQPCGVSTKELLKNTPEVEGTAVKVPAVFGELE